MVEHQVPQRLQQLRDVMEDPEPPSQQSDEAPAVLLLNLRRKSDVGTQSPIGTLEYSVARRSEIFGIYAN